MRRSARFPAAASTAAVLLLASTGLSAGRSPFPGTEPFAPFVLLDRPGAIPAESGGGASVDGVPIALASADFDRDGFPDLAVANERGQIEIRFGDREAFAPSRPETLRALSEGHSVPTFRAARETITVDLRPDLLASVDVDRDGALDLVLAERGSGSLVVLRILGGAFASPRTIPLPGRVTALLATELGPGNSIDGIAVAIDGPAGAELLLDDASTPLFEQPWQVIALPSAASLLAAGALDDEPGPDLALACGAKVLLLHGADRSTDELELGEESSALLVADLDFDREARSELTVISRSGRVRIFERGSADRRAWTGAELSAARAALPLGPRPISGEREPFRLRTTIPIVDRSVGEGPANPGFLGLLRASPGGALDRDLLALDAGGALSLLAAPRPALSSAAFARAASPLDAGSAITAVLPMRLGVLAEDGLVIATSGSDQPLVAMPAVTSTVVVNSAADSIGTCASTGTGTCTLRDAIRYANSHAGSDLVTFAPALDGTPITLTLPNASGKNEDLSSTGDLDVTESLTLLGNGATNTILQAGTSTANGIDKVFALNPACDRTVDVSISGVTIRYGRNSQAAGSLDYSQTGGGLDWCGFGGSALTITASTISGNSVQNASGGGLNVDTPPGGTGTVTLTGTTVSGNVSKTHGGGISVTGDGPVLVLDGGSVVSSNSTQGGTGISDAQGGGVFVRAINNPPATGHATLSGATITGNIGNMGGGGICLGSGGGGQNLTVTGGTISGNTAQAGSSNAAFGGGLLLDNLAGYSATLSYVTTSGNHADLGTVSTLGGGGIFLRSGTLAMTGGTLDSNTAGSGNTNGRGGGLSVAAGSATLTGVSILANSAKSGGGALYVSGGSLDAQLCRIVGNTAGVGSGITRIAGTASVTNDWWGCDGVPGDPGCDGGFGFYSALPRIDLVFAAAPGEILPGGSATVSLDLTRNTAGSLLAAGSAPPVLVGRPLTFTGDPHGTLSGPPTENVPGSGRLDRTFTANGGTGACGPAAPTVTLDSGTQSAEIAVAIPGSVPGLGDSLRLAVAGIEARLSWTDLPEATDYVVFEDSDPAGGFSVIAGTAASGSTGLLLPLSGGGAFWKVAGRNACGLGPKD